MTRVASRRDEGALSREGSEFLQTDYFIGQKEEFVFFSNFKPRFAIFSCITRLPCEVEKNCKDQLACFIGEYG